MDKLYWNSHRICLYYNFPQYFNIIMDVLGSLNFIWK